MSEPKNEVKSLPMIPLRGISAFPNTVLNFDVERPKSIAALDAAMADNRRVFLLAQRDLEIEEPELSDLYVVGTVCRIRQLLILIRRRLVDNLAVSDVKLRQCRNVFRKIPVFICILSKSDRSAVNRIYIGGDLRIGFNGRVCFCRQQIIEICRHQIRRSRIFKAFRESFGKFSARRNPPRNQIGRRFVCALAAIPHIKYCFYLSFKRGNVNGGTCVNNHNHVRINLRDVENKIFRRRIQFQRKTIGFLFLRKPRISYAHHGAIVFCRRFHGVTYSERRENVISDHIA